MSSTAQRAARREAAPQRASARKLPAERSAVPQSAPYAVLTPPIAYRMADEWFPLARADHFWVQWRFHVLTRLLPTKDLGEHILEVGCGNGVARAQFEAYYGRAVPGCDVNAYALGHAAPGRGDLYCYDVLTRRTPWREHFDTLLLLDVLEHIPDPVAFLSALRDHLRPGGRLVLTVPAQPWLYSRYDEVDGHLRRYTRAMLNEQLAGAGFHLERSTYWGLSLLPIVLLRKWWLRNCPHERVIATGFQPPSRAADAVLRTLMRIECGLLPCPPWGASLAAVARRD